MRNNMNEADVLTGRAGAVSSFAEDGTLRRGQFTFYDSFFKALNGLPRSRQLETYRAIAGYALYGTEPELSGSARSVFDAIRPVLDSGRAKAEARLKAGGK